MRRSLNCFRARPTTSCEVIPAGLSTIAKPSVTIVGVQLLENRLDSLCASLDVVGQELEIGGLADARLLPHRAPRFRAEPLERADHVGAFIFSVDGRVVDARF